MKRRFWRFPTIGEVRDSDMADGESGWRVLGREILFYPIDESTCDTISLIEEDGYPDRFENFEKSEWKDISSRRVRYFSPDSLGDPSVNRRWGMEIEDTLLIYSDGGNEIHYSRTPTCNRDIVKFWMLHTFIPMHLEICGEMTLLHCGGVLRDGREGPSILFVAPAFGGKSTLVSHFSDKGHTLICDDFAGIVAHREGRGYLSIPSYPHIRISRDPESLGEYVGNFSKEPREIGAIFFLDRVEPDSRVDVVRLQGHEKFHILKLSCFVDFSFLKRERMEILSDMARKIPIYRIEVPYDMERLEEVYETILSISREEIS